MKFTSLLKIVKGVRVVDGKFNEHERAGNTPWAQGRRKLMDVQQREEDS
jgi:hypothetical protein